MIGGALPVRAPYHLQATVRVLQRRPTNRVDVLVDGCYRRVLRTAEGNALVEVRNDGTIDAPELHYVLRGGRASRETGRLIEPTLRRILGLDLDPGALSALADAGGAVGRTALALRGMRMPRYPELFEAFANIVPFQQVSLDAGSAVLGRLVERFGARVDHRGTCCFAFPAAADIAAAPVEQIRESGLSMRKAGTLQRLAEAVHLGRIDEAALADMSTADALRALEALPGIGPWSAGVMMLRGFARADVFPPGDAGAARGLAALLDLPPGARVDDVVRRFGEQRGYLYFCVLGSSLLAKGLIDPAPPIA